MAVSFREMECACEKVFQSFGPTYHVCSSEDFEIIFRNDDDFRAGMGILAICCKLFPIITIHTFQLMNNHFHIVLSGQRNDIDGFLSMFTYRLQKYFEFEGRFLPIKNIKVNIFTINSLSYFRSAVAYDNRNGFVVNDNCSPYSYPWGANRCFYNIAMLQYYRKCRKVMTTTEIRSIFHSKDADGVKTLYCLDGCVSPLSFCDIAAVEHTFRNEKQYFYAISKNVESYGDIAKDIGEMVVYTDEDIYMIACGISVELFSSKNLSLLDADSKIQIARLLHTKYRAGNKQIHRVLKIGLNVLESMF